MLAVETLLSRPPYKDFQDKGVYHTLVVSFYDEDRSVEKVRNKSEILSDPTDN